MTLLRHISGCFQLKHTLGKSQISHYRARAQTLSHSIRRLSHMPDNAFTHFACRHAGRENGRWHRLDQESMDYK